MRRNKKFASFAQENKMNEVRNKVQQLKELAKQQEGLPVQMQLEYAIEEGSKGVQVQVTFDTEKFYARGTEQDLTAINSGLDILIVHMTELMAQLALVVGLNLTFDVTNQICRESHPPQYSMDVAVTVGENSANGVKHQLSGFGIKQHFGHHNVARAKFALLRLLAFEMRNHKPQPVPPATQETVQ